MLLKGLSDEIYTKVLIDEIMIFILKLFLKILQQNQKKKEKEK